MRYNDSEVIYMEFNIDVFSKLDKEWALLAAGTPEDHNAMTVSWGGMGTLWGKPVVTVYVRHSRHTFGYMEKGEFFSLSFYAPEFRRALALMGSKSGRDIDKDAASGLTPVAAGDTVTYREAQVTLVCRKLYSDELDLEKIPPEIIDACYADGDGHRLYIGEVVEIIRGE